MNQSIATSPLVGLDNEIRELRSIGKLFYQRGWSVGTSSNFSCVISHSPLEILVTASGKDKGDLQNDDFVRVDRKGKPVSAEQPKSSAETLLHVVAAEYTGANVILHTHSVWATILSNHYFDQGGIWIEGFEMLKGLDRVTTHEHREWVPIFDNTQDIPHLAKQVSHVFENPEMNLHGYLIRRHGLYTWGPDFQSARRQVEIFEFLFECLGRELQLKARA
ncbi:MAG TPA: methylthioribulose 1-phosphate dehydratase [Pirellulaceae bacterium]|nr:methylthioribulose 1-phosphate dehydratase [Pirellulaceae bacterium]HMO90816.1 methylthioribulose 1-phosphate dehydratase [Pirellulaceae bacterium]HMP68067.1 methylthioribulose 1-phosphate dehydratase [Pirellulaceae bacterium]